MFIYIYTLHIARNGTRSNLLAHYRRQDIFHIYNHNNNNCYYYYYRRRRRYYYHTSTRLLATDSGIKRANL